MIYYLPITKRSKVCSIIYCHSIFTFLIATLKQNTKTNGWKVPLPSVILQYILYHTILYYT